MNFEMSSLVFVLEVDGQELTILRGYAAKMLGNAKSKTSSLECDDPEAPWHNIRIDYYISMLRHYCTNILLYKNTDATVCVYSMIESTYEV